MTARSTTPGPVEERPLTGARPPRHHVGAELSSVAGLLVTPDDQLVVRQFNFRGPNAGAGFTVAARLLLPDGTIRVLQQFFPYSGALVLTDNALPLSDGVLLGVTLTSTISVTYGDVFAILQIQRGQVTGAVVTDVLASGVVTSGMSLSWPNSVVQRPEDTGLGTTLVTSSPAAGTDPQVGFTAATGWVAQYALGTLVASATVANRVVGVKLTTALGGQYQASGGFNQVAGSTVTYVASTQPFVGQYQNTTIVGIPLPILAMENGGGSFQFLTANLQAGDQWGSTLFTFARRPAWN